MKHQINLPTNVPACQLADTQPEFTQSLWAVLSSKLVPLPPWFSARHLAIQFRDVEPCRAGSIDGILRDMDAFYTTAKSLGQSAGTHDDTPAKRVHLQKLGYALLDLGKSACRVMKRLVENLPASPEPPVEREWQQVVRKWRKSRR